MRFVALDLETTWLSPETDTIIEVAAVSFWLEQDEFGSWRTTDTIEHSQLVYPGREMTEEISMITGITDTMLTGKPTWAEVRDKVRDFIRTDSVIVGHNVLFDVAMLRTHGIDLSEYPILDTFELSEILSQDIESLNLGYLAWAYGLSAWDKEHRALGDTRLSVGLFVHYLNVISNISESKKRIFTLTSKCEEKKNIWLLTEILGWDDTTIPAYSLQSNKETYLNTLSIKPWTETNNTEPQVAKNCNITSLPLGRVSEWTFLKEHIKAWEKVSIGVFWYVQTLYMQSLTEELGYSSEIYHAPSEYCSIDELWERINRGNWKRKESILITKLLYWLEGTETWLIKELKLYGEEREEIVFYRMQEWEYNHYYSQLQNSLNAVDVVIYDMSKHIGGVNSSEPKTKTLIIKDITLLEEAMRRNNSISISIENLTKSLWEFEDTERLIETIRFIEAIYLEFPDRPTWPEISPPGGYGETYFVSQSDIWHRGCVNLSLVSNSLLELYNEWKSKRTIWTRREKLLMKIIEQSIGWLLRFHLIQDTTGAIIEIQHNCLSISLIPRDVREETRGLLAFYNNVILYGTGLSGPKVQHFLESEVGIITEVQNYLEGQEGHDFIIDSQAIHNLATLWNLGGTVILTTSAKHIREIGRSLEKTWFKILMQGISWGKGKQLGIFKSNPEWAILIGTIDMWKEELELWNHAKHIILAKLPFDPPTDAYFLARTVGMKNNFSLYSEPMLIIKVNTLLSRIYSSNYVWVIYCEDTRLTETIWGKELRKEIV